MATTDFGRCLPRTRAHAPTLLLEPQEPLPPRRARAVLHRGLELLHGHLPGALPVELRRPQLRSRHRPGRAQDRRAERLNTSGEAIGGARRAPRTDTSMNVRVSAPAQRPTVRPRAPAERANDTTRPVGCRTSFSLSFPKESATPNKCSNLALQAIPETCYDLQRNLTTQPVVYHCYRTRAPRAQANNKIKSVFDGCGRVLTMLPK